MIKVIHKEELDVYRVEMKSLRIKIPLTLYVATKVYSCQTIKSVSQVIELALEEYLNK